MSDAVKIALIANFATLAGVLIVAMFGLMQSRKNGQKADVIQGTVNGAADRAHKKILELVEINQRLHERLREQDDEARRMKTGRRPTRDRDFKGED